MSTDEKSLTDLKRIARASLQEAAKAEPCVTVTEKNWQAVIRLLGVQEQMLEQLLAEQQELASWDDLQSFLEEQKVWMERSKQVTAEFQSALKQSAEEAAKALSSQAGKLSESSSSFLSSAREQMRSYQRRLFWLSLIPSLTLLLLELALQLWPLIFPA